MTMMATLHSCVRKLVPYMADDNATSKALVFGTAGAIEPTSNFGQIERTGDTDTFTFTTTSTATLNLRIDPDTKPTMFHYATISKGEIETLRKITNVIRMGHVRALEADRLVLDQGSVPLAPNTLCIDCTASAVEPRPIQKIFQGDKIVPQLVRVPLATFSAALVAYVEAHYEDDKAKNRLCGVVPFPDGPEGYPAATMVSMMNQFNWSQDKELRTWIRNSRLDGFGRVIAGVAKDDEEKLAILQRYKNGAMAAMGNMPRLMGEQAAG